MKISRVRYAWKLINPTYQINFRKMVKFMKHGKYLTQLSMYFIFGHFVQLGALRYAVDMMQRVYEIPGLSRTFVSNNFSFSSFFEQLLPAFKVSTSAQIGKL